MAIGTPTIEAIRTFWPKLYQRLMPWSAAIAGFGVSLVMAAWFFKSARPVVNQTARVMFAALGCYLCYTVPMILLVNAQYRYQSGGILFLCMASLCSLYLAVALAMLPWRRFRRVAVAAAIEDATQTPGRQTSP
jgi:hypothetical protein